MNVLEIVREYLRAKLFDGLANLTTDCGCETLDLSPGNCMCEECEAAWKVPCDCGEHDDFHYTSDFKEAFEPCESCSGYRVADCAIVRLDGEIEMGAGEIGLKPEDGKTYVKKGAKRNG